MEPNEAVPDPHVEEMQLLTFQPKPRTCKIPIIPRRQDYIEIKWCIDYLPNLPERWCIAEVLHVSRGSAQNVIATGVLRYLPDQTWQEEIHQVDFLEGHHLRRIADHTEDDECDEAENPNPKTKWRPAVNNKDSSAPSDDEEWSIDKHHYAPAGTETIKTPACDSRGTEFHSLRAGYASLVVEVEKIKKELLNQSHALTTIRRHGFDDEICSSAGCVIQRLRHKLCLKMQISVRSMMISPRTLGKRPSREPDQSGSENRRVQTQDGVHVGNVRARVECTLQQFENIARRIKTNARPESVLFAPDFLHTQLPAQCSAAFRIMFKTFLDLTTHLGVSSYSDFLEMARKCGSCSQGDILRILATYDFDETDASSASRIFLGSSCGKRGLKRSPIIESNNREGFENQAVVLTRQSRNWNIVDRRFSHPAKLEYYPFPELEEHVNDAETFSLAWKRGHELGPRTWSKAVTESNTVFGWLEVCLPYIQVEGEYLCAEIGALAGDEEWEHMFHSLRNKIKNPSDALL